MVTWFQSQNGQMIMEKNYTTGSVYKNVLLFSLPYLLSYFLQTLYGMADLFIIGQMGDSRSPMYFIAVACAANIFRCGKAGACRADPAVCNSDRRRLRPRCLYCDAVCRGAGRLAVYRQERGGRSRCHPLWRAVSPRLHIFFRWDWLRLPARSYPC